MPEVIFAITPDDKRTVYYDSHRTIREWEAKQYTIKTITQQQLQELQDCKRQDVQSLLSKYF